MSGFLKKIQTTSKGISNHDTEILDHIYDEFNLHVAKAIPVIENADDPSQLSDLLVNYVKTKLTAKFGKNHG